MISRYSRFPWKAAVLSAALLFFCTAEIIAQPGPPGRTGGPGGAPAKTVVVLGNAKIIRPKITKKYTGLIEPIEKVAVVARVSGKITGIFFKEGEMVKKGDLLITIEDEEWKANVEAAQASVDAAQAAIVQMKAKLKELDAILTYKENTYKRNEALFSQNSVISKDDLENTQSAMEASRAQRAAMEASLMESQASLKLAQANLALKKLDLERTRIAAEISGKTGRLTYTLGNYVTPSREALLTISQYDPVYVRFSMNERDLSDLGQNREQLQKTESVRIVLANGEEYPLKGKIKFYDNQIESSTDTITVWAQLPNPKYELSPGGIAKVILDLTTADATPAVPVSAVLRDSRGEYVYVVDEKGVAHSRRIVPGVESEGFQAIASGLKGDERIVVDGTHKVMGGAEVIDENEALAPLPKDAAPDKIPSSKIKSEEK
ncbi:MAG: efflux RND transporter periplasmic adaptor subunit [Planctomycetia bacterium]|nr:efflux RND transporter periplasmic adaptor subunit [Planctomycetia bacterium]